VRFIRFIGQSGFRGAVRAAVKWALCRRDSGFVTRLCARRVETAGGGGGGWIVADDWDYDPNLGFVNQTTGELVESAPSAAPSLPATRSQGRVIEPPAVPAGAPRAAQPTPILPGPVERFLNGPPTSGVPAQKIPNDWDPYKMPLYFRRMFWALLERGFHQRVGAPLIIREWQMRFDAAVYDLQRDRPQCEAELGAFEAFLPAVIWHTNMGVTSADDRGRGFVVYPYVWPGEDGSQGIHNKPAECPGYWEPPPKPAYRNNTPINPSQRFAARMAGSPRAAAAPSAGASRSIPESRAARKSDTPGLFAPSPQNQLRH
jgi:hypothetical protein